MIRPFRPPLLPPPLPSTFSPLLSAAKTAPVIILIRDSSVVSKWRRVPLLEIFFFLIIRFDEEEGRV